MRLVANHATQGVCSGCKCVAMTSFAGDVNDPANRAVMGWSDECTCTCSCHDTVRFAARHFGAATVS